MKRFFLPLILIILLFSSCNVQYNAHLMKKGAFFSSQTPQSPGIIEAYPGFLNPQSSQKAWSGYPAPIEDPILPLDQLPSVPTAVMPQPGKGSISGVLFSFTNHMIVPKTFYYLTPGWGTDKSQPPPGFSGPNIKNGDIIGRSDEKGQISLDAVSPGTYFLVVESGMNWVAGVNSDLNPTLRPIIVEADKKSELGIIYLSWP